MIKIYHNPRCRKSREALALIQEKRDDITIIEYLKTPLSTAELVEILSLMNLRPMDIVRKGEQIYKDKFKGKALTDEAWIEAMIEHPKLMERPIVVNGNKAVIGRPPEQALTVL